MDRMEKITASICLATYNGATYIQEQLASILEQLGPDDEVVVSDDNSTDNTLDLVRNFGDGRIRIYPNAQCGKPATNFSRAIALSTKKLIVLADQDDRWLPGRMEHIRQVLGSAKKTCIMLDGYMANAQGEVIESSIQRHLNSGPGILKNIKKNTWMGCCMAFTADLKPRLLPIPEDLPMHDSWIGLLAEIYGKVWFSTYQGIAYRVHGSNKSLQGYGFLQQLIWRVQLIVQLALRVVRGKQPRP